MYNVFKCSHVTVDSRRERPVEYVFVAEHESANSGFTLNLPMADLDSFEPGRSYRIQLVPLS